MSPIHAAVPLSPAWLGRKPTAKDRARYRTFEASLDDKQQHELALALRNGPLSRYEATYTDIVDLHRIITTYDMWIDGTHMSTSVASLEFQTIPSGTRLTQVEHGVFLDQFWQEGGPRWW